MNTELVDALKILKNDIDSPAWEKGCICDTVPFLNNNDKLTDSQTSLLKKFLGTELPEEAYPHPPAFPSEPADDADLIYCWPFKEAEVRVAWLNEQIEKIKG